MTERLCDQKLPAAHTHGSITRTRVVVGITLVTMAGEIVFGLLTGSMALLADGIHMGTHTFALLVTLLAYRIAARHADDPDFAFSSGKVGVLGGYTNAVILGITALAMIYEAVHRMIEPQPISYTQALIVAVVGLVVNLVSALLLSSGGHAHGHDHNLRSAYLHVLTDAMTSVLAIIALLAGRLFDQSWPDAWVAVLGALVILKWAYGLLVSSGSILVDHYRSDEERTSLQHLAESFGAHMQDLHIWQLSEQHRALIMSITVGKEFDRTEFLHAVNKTADYHHITLEVTDDTLPLMKA